MQAKVYMTQYLNGTATTSHYDCLFHDDTENRELNIINLYPDVMYQVISGFGGAITEAVGITLGQMPDEIANEVIKAYFGEYGLGFRFVRTHIDSCDFALGNYSAVENPDDKDFSYFSLTRDEENIIPWIRKAYQAANSEFPVMLTPWSPPAFMKTNGDKNHGGKLKPEYYGAWAKYICRYIKEYRKRGINVRMLSVQNEPNAVQTWDSCIFMPDDERVFLQSHLWPALNNCGLSDVGIYIWDHNKERVYDRACAIIDDITAHMIDGVAFHWYSGDHFEALELVRQKFPEKKLVFTEGCIKYSRFDLKNQLANAQMYAHDIIGNFNAGMNLFIDWNIALDHNGGPNHAGNFCEAPIMCNTQEGTFYKNLSYQYLWHFSRFIQCGSTRIATTKYSSEIELMAVKNPDDTIVSIILNKTEKAQNIYVRMNQQLLSLTLPAQSLHSIIIS